jgi:hypothetical protein
MVMSLIVVAIADLWPVFRGRLDRVEGRPANSPRGDFPQFIHISAWQFLQQSASRLGGPVYRVIDCVDGERLSCRYLKCSFWRCRPRAEGKDQWLSISYPKDVASSVTRRPAMSNT